MNCVLCRKRLLLKENLSKEVEKQQLRIHNLIQEIDDIVYIHPQYYNNRKQLEKLTSDGKENLIQSRQLVMDRIQQEEKENTQRIVELDQQVILHHTSSSVR